MIDALIHGCVAADPERSQRNGKDFMTFKLTVADREGGRHPAACIVLDEGCMTALAGLARGDSVAVAGEVSIRVLKPEGGEPRPWLRVVVRRVLGVTA